MSFHFLWARPICVGLLITSTGAEINRPSPLTQSTTVCRIVLLYDNSNSQNLNLYGVPLLATQVKIALPRDLVIEKLAANLGAGAQLRIGSFGGRVLMSPNWVRSAVDIRKAFQDVTQDGGPSPLWDGIWESVDVLRSVRERRVIVVQTDGKASANTHGFVEVMDYVLQQKVTVHVVLSDQSDNRTPSLNSPGERGERLYRLAIASGGSYAERSLRGLPSYIGDIVRRLSSQ